jgi:hypothetical protein
MKIRKTLDGYMIEANKSDAVYFGVAANSAAHTSAGIVKLENGNYAVRPYDDALSTDEYNDLFLEMCLLLYHHVYGPYKEPK